MLTAQNSASLYPGSTLLLAQSVADRLPSALAPGDRAMLESIGRPEPCIDVPGAVIVPGSGPHVVDYALTGGPLSQYPSCVSSISSAVVTLVVSVNCVNRE